jgi:hypothetical protein
VEHGGKTQRKIIKIHFIQDKTAFYLVVSNIITTFATDKERNIINHLNRAATVKRQKKYEYYNLRRSSEPEGTFPHRTWRTIPQRRT